MRGSLENFIYTQAQCSKHPCSVYANRINLHLLCREMLQRQSSTLFSQTLMEQHRMRSQILSQYACSVTQKFAMHKRRWNVRLSRRGREGTFRDARSSPRRYDCINEAPSRSYISRLTYYVFRPNFESFNQKELSTSAWVLVCSADMQAILKVLSCVS